MLAGLERTSNISKLQMEWLNSLEAYLGQLQQIDGLTKQLQLKVSDILQQQRISALRIKILLQKNVISSIAEEVRNFKNRFNSKQNKDDVAELMARNKMRDRVLKEELKVFELKYKVTQLLSRTPPGSS